VGPVVVLFVIAVFVFVELPGIKNIPEATAGEEQLEVKVTGRQFYWQYEYPNGVIAIDQLRAPVGVPVKLIVSAPNSDVIHSWWIPALGGKIDAIPSRTNETWFEADNEGVYTGQCAELCGLEHARMLASVEVVSQAAFDTWLAERAGADGAAELGKEEWEGVCAKCHGLAGQGGIGPRIAGSPTLTDPVALAALVRNGRRSMPAVGSGWTDEQIDALATYLEENPPSGVES
jgi:cytochrome c oxidase subunit 2